MLLCSEQFDTLFLKIEDRNYRPCSFKERYIAVFDLISPHTPISKHQDGYLHYSKTCLKRTIKNRLNNDLKDRW